MLNSENSEIMRMEIDAAAKEQAENVRQEINNFLSELEKRTDNLTLGTKKIVAGDLLDAAKTAPNRHIACIWRTAAIYLTLKAREHEQQQKELESRLST